MKKTIYTHVSTKAVQGMARLAELSGRRVYMWPMPYKRSDGRDGWTVVVTRDS